ncbi:GDSL-like Lipase/Acylhydrolase [Poriferisphaera corsica]|uniref:GDSL-like Lipase/Acylhydrolase n=1 Tax=Poriferisphaera corsica TaxID=2528020 RepID=A0A517YY91_9BACT|nr:SGNH/GDSL hydrolase family protein [Poriferisphaera corsica]QDU35188.1 GDSL-like Lipase/Acylhydrolase [Poriferisphaera corsica]
MQRIKARLQSEQPITWLFYGDSITHGLCHTNTQRNYVDHFHERIRGEMARIHDIVLNTAISGQTTKNLIAEYDHRVTKRIPDVIFLMIGMNDCAQNELNVPLPQFAENLDTLIDMNTKLGTDTILQTTCPVLPGGFNLDRENSFNDYMQAIRDAAQKHNLPIIDHAKLWQSASPYAHINRMSDPFHPNAFGHAAFTHLIFSELGILEPQSATSQFAQTHAMQPESQPTS